MCVLSDLCSPNSPLFKTYLDLSVILTNHYALKKLVITEKYGFHNCVHKDGEYVSIFVSNLACVTGSIRGHKGGKLEMPPAQILSILSSPAAG